MTEYSDRVRADYRRLCAEYGEICWNIQNLETKKEDKKELINQHQSMFPNVQLVDDELQKLRDELKELKEPEGKKENKADPKEVKPEQKK